MAGSPFWTDPVPQAGQSHVPFPPYPGEGPGTPGDSRPPGRAQGQDGDPAAQDPCARTYLALPPARLAPPGPAAASDIAAHPPAPGSARPPPGCQRPPWPAPAPRPTATGHRQSASSPPRRSHPPAGHQHDPVRGTPGHHQIPGTGHRRKAQAGTPSAGARPHGRGARSCHRRRGCRDHAVRRGLGQPIAPGRDGGGEMIAIGRAHPVVPPVPSGNAATERQDAPRDPHLLPAPAPRFSRIPAPARLAHRTKDMLPGNGYSTLPRQRRSSRQESLGLPSDCCSARLPMASGPKPENPPPRGGRQILTRGPNCAIGLQTGMTAPSSRAAALHRMRRQAGSNMEPAAISSLACAALESGDRLYRSRRARRA
jgi:hypothetical protein